MKHAIDAIYENGSFRPLPSNPVKMPEGQRVRIVVEDQNDPEPLRLAMSVYQGLSAQDIDDIERIAMDRGNFFRKNAD